MSEWIAMVNRINARNKNVKIALVGKYVKLHDAYLSVVEALSHGGFENGAEVEIKWIDAELVTDFSAKDLLSDCDGILISGGFGDRGIDGKISAIKFARENNVHFLEICLGMQAAAIEFASNVLGFKDANSSEFNPDGKCSVIDLMNGQLGEFAKRRDNEAESLPL